MNRSSRTAYKVELPGRWQWTLDYDLAYQLATGVRVEEGGDDHPEEDRITAFGASPRTVECVYCDEAVSEGLIARHHTDEHPMERFNPSWYVEEVRSA